MRVYKAVRKKDPEIPGPKHAFNQILGELYEAKLIASGEITPWNSI